MRRTLPSVVLLALLACGAAADDRRRRKRSPEEKRNERLEEIVRKRERRLRVRQPAPENVFLHDHAAELIAQARTAIQDEYRFDRVSRAANALLEASERIFEARRPPNKRDNEDEDDDGDDHRRTARRLERCFFRVKQADYFAHQSAAPRPEQYLRTTRSLYQQARSAYDLRDYRKARLLAEAAALTVDALERLAQAAVPIPVPPRLP